MPFDQFVKEQVCQEAWSRFPRDDITPRAVAEQLAEWVPCEISRLYGKDAPADADRWAATLVTACCYGPEDKIPPPDDLVEQLVERADFSEPGDQLAVERVLVFGLLDRDPNATGWDGEWPGAWEALRCWVKAQISPSVRRIGEYLALDDATNPVQWASDETMECAAFLAMYLVRGCRCWERWEDYQISSDKVATAICAGQHQLTSWDRRSPLNNFLRRAVVARGFPQVNGFRKAMLAKYVVQESLVAGQILRCADPECSGEIATNNLCERCGKHEPSNEPDWWMWQKGQRVLWYCRRCGECRGLFLAIPVDQLAVAAKVSSGMTCPTCGVDEWKPRMTKVWVPVESYSAEQPNLDAYVEKKYEDSRRRDRDLDED